MNSVTCPSCKYGSSKWSATLLLLIPLLVAALYFLSGSPSFGAPGMVSPVKDFAPAEAWVKEPEKDFRADICLNGLWQFQPVDMPKGLKDNEVPELTAPLESAWEKTPLKIPSPWNVNSFADEKGLGGDFRTYPSYPKKWEEVKMGWMKRQVTVPADWKGRRVILQFDAVAGDTVVLVNGKEAGRRFDIFFPFQIDVSDMVKFGEANEILVGVRKASLFDKRGGKYGRRTYQGGSFWGQHAAGIWQDVNLVALPALHVSNVFVQPLVDQDLLKTEVTVRNDGTTEMEVQVSGSAYRWLSLAGKSEVEKPVPLWKLEKDPALALSSASVVIPPGSEKVITLEKKTNGALKLWEQADPSLYGLLVDLKTKSGTAIDRKYTRFGWRQVQVIGSGLTLNGKPLVLKGESWHFLGIPQMTRRYASAWYQAVRDANGNAVRLHAQPYPEFYLDVADEMGILILDETAIWASDGGPKLDDDDYWNDTEDHVAQLVKRDRNHPSVFGWSVCNEVRPVVQNVFHGPPSMMETLVKHYASWRETCRKLDPTRNWISADGDDDGDNTLPTYVIHYGDEGTMDRASKSGKPWGVGEASGAYYMTPEQSSKYNGERSYESFEGRMEGIAIESYEHLLMQKKHKSSYQSVFNLVWYALQPLPLGMKDTTKPPSLEDGVYFEGYVEGKPGVQPERLGPYCTTLNPGYDPSLPVYKTWPLFEAIKNANADNVLPIPWKRVEKAAAEIAGPEAKTVQSIDIAAEESGRLFKSLEVLGVPFATLKKPGVPQVLFVDGINPPNGEKKALIDQVLNAGGTVMVWGLDKGSLSRLNALLPAAVELTDRKSSSFLAVGQDSLLAGLTPSKMYFSELSPPEVLTQGIDGPIMKNAEVLIKANDTDWLLWNKRAEYAKTAMVHRSEQESKASGAALIRVKQGQGQLLICNLQTEPKLFKAQVMDRTLLQNLGIPLAEPADVGAPFLKTGGLVRTLAAGRFPVSEQVMVKSDSGASIREGVDLTNKSWKIVDADKGVFNFNNGPIDGHHDNVVVYLSFWVQSPRSLDNLLLEPNIPRVDFKMKTNDELEFSLNGKSLLTKKAGEAEAVAKGLPIQQGWNHFLVKLVHEKGEFPFEGALECSQPAFLSELTSASQKP